MQAIELIPYAFSGVQILDPEIFNYLPEKDVFSLVDLYLNVSGKEKIIGYRHDDDDWIDLGKIENLSNAEKMLERIKNTYRA